MQLQEPKRNEKTREILLARGARQDWALSAGNVACDS